MHRWMSVFLIVIMLNAVNFSFVYAQDLDVPANDFAMWLKY